MKTSFFGLFKRDWQIVDSKSFDKFMCILYEGHKIEGTEFERKTTYVLQRCSLTGKERACKILTDSNNNGDYYYRSGKFSIDVLEAKMKIGLIKDSNKEN